MHHILDHAETAFETGISQNSFIENLNLSSWIIVHNVFEKYEIRRYPANVSLLYIFAEKNLPNLIRSELQRVRHMDIRGERYGSPPMAAIVYSNEAAVREFLRPGLQEHAVTARSQLSMQNESDLGNQISLILQSAQGRRFTPRR